MVTAAAADLPTLRYYFDGSTAQVALYRWGRPCTAIRHGGASERLAHGVRDTMAEFHMSCHIIELSWLELGDHVGVIRRMRSRHAQVFATQEAGLATLYRQVLARALCASSQEADWESAMELTAPFLRCATWHSSRTPSRRAWLCCAGGRWRLCPDQAGHGRLCHAAVLSARFGGNADRLPACAGAVR